MRCVIRLFSVPLQTTGTEGAISFGTKDASSSKEVGALHHRRETQATIKTCAWTQSV